MRKREATQIGREFRTLRPTPARATIAAAMTRTKPHHRLLPAGMLLMTAVVALSSCLGPVANRPPVARFDATPREGYAPFTVHFSAVASTDPDGDSLRYAWDFGDGKTGEGKTIDHVFYEGSYEVTLEVFDPRGGVDAAATTVIARDVPDGYIVRNFEWVYDGRTRYWSMLIPWNLYQTYRGRLRTTLAGAYAYGDYVADPLDDPTLAEYSDVLWNLVDGRRLDFIECALSFVQGAIAYQPDPSGREWPLYPLETLVDGIGDCEDTSILLVSLLRSKGVASDLAFVDTDGDRTPDHILVLVEISKAEAAQLACPDGPHGTVLMLDRSLYAVAETAVEGTPLPLGCDPWDLTVDDIAQVWSF